jgi:F-type H+-transporting ATPase subunit delta
MTSRTAARRYARAMFDVALAERMDPETLDRDLSAFARIVAGHDLLQRTVTNPAIPAARKRAVLEQLLRQVNVAPLVAKVLLLLADRDRLVLLPELVEAYHSRLLDHQQVVRAEVTTAADLPADRVAALEDGLARVTGRRVLLDVRVDPSLVGGAVARIGSTVYDGSVTTQLEKMKQRLIEADV